MKLSRCSAGLLATALGATVVTSCTGTSAGTSADRPASEAADNTGDKRKRGGQVIVPGRPGEPVRTMPAEKVPTGSVAHEPNKTDIRFVRMMIPHHYQALQMTELVPDRASAEKVRGLAKRIEDTQRVEIDAMQDWQERRGVEVTDAASSYRKQLDNTKHLRMMGMATPAEMDKLAAAEGKEFDRLFLRLMKTHHQGAVAMAEKVLVRGRDVGVKQLAKDILVTQKDEIARMHKLLGR